MAMKYQIVCDHCGKAFLTEGDGGQTIECQCPHCGGLIRCKLPEVDEEQTNIPPRLAAKESTSLRPDEEKRGGSGCGIMVAAAMLVFIAVLAGMIVYSMSDQEQSKGIEDPYQVFEDRPDTADVIMVDTVEPEPEVEEEPDSAVYEEELQDSLSGDTQDPADLSHHEQENVMDEIMQDSMGHQQDYE